MYCDVCGGLNGHKSGCPESTFEPKALETCDICKEGIYEDDEYVESLYGDVAHLECARDLSTRELLQWLHIDVTKMR